MERTCATYAPNWVLIKNGNRAHLLGNLKRKYKDHILGDLGKQKSKRAWHMHSMVLRDLVNCKMIMIQWKQENPFLMATVENVAESGGEAPLDKTFRLHAALSYLAGDDVGIKSKSNHVCASLSAKNRKEMQVLIVF